MAVESYAVTASDLAKNVASSITGAVGSCADEYVSIIAPVNAKVSFLHAFPASPLVRSKVIVAISVWVVGTVTPTVPASKYLQNAAGLVR